MYNIRCIWRLLCKSNILPLKLYRGYCAQPATEKKLNILFFGTDNFSLPSLMLLDKSREWPNSKINHLDVITTFKGFNVNPVLKYAKNNNLKCMDWKVFKNDNNRMKYDLGVVVSFGHLIPENLINQFLFGMVNVHPSLLPRWRGSAPIIHAILHEDDVTGVSIMAIRPHKFDAGEIFLQEKFPIPKLVLMSELFEALSNEGAKLLAKFIHGLPNSMSLARKQGNQNVTYAPRISDSMPVINWKTMSSRYICNLFRALYSFKWLQTHWHGRKITITEIDITETSLGSMLVDHRPPGYVEYDKKHKYLRVHCIDGQCIRIKRLKIEGKRVMTASEFYCGYISKVNSCDRFFD